MKFCKLKHPNIKNQSKREKTLKLGLQFDNYANLTIRKVQDQFSKKQSYKLRQNYHPTKIEPNWSISTHFNLTF